MGVDLTANGGQPRRSPPSFKCSRRPSDHGTRAGRCPTLTAETRRASLGGRRPRFWTGTPADEGRTGARKRGDDPLFLGAGGVLPALVGKRKKLPLPGHPGWGPKSDPLRLGMSGPGKPIECLSVTQTCLTFRVRAVVVTFPRESCANDRPRQPLRPSVGGSELEGSRAKGAGTTKPPPAVMAGGGSVSQAYGLVWRVYAG